MYIIQNEQLEIVVAAKGAELQKIYNKETGLDYLWSGDPAFWGKHSPVLFPIVGTLKDGSYLYNNQTYHLSRHGFARDLEFTVIHQSEAAISFSLQQTAATLEQYPFYFELRIHYRVKENRLHIQYEVLNQDEKTLWFSIGAHPAFKVPLVKGTSFEDYVLCFNEFENTGRYPLTDDGLLAEDPQIFLQNTDELPLKKSLFYEDALVFKTLQSSSIKLESPKTENGLTVDFKGFPYMGIWSARDADFVCIEPWLGITDSVTTSGKLEEKEGILSLAPGETFTADWAIMTW
ncbi:aldose 1-epimerase family protein [Arachidicoccus terrestris]|uniref:aldose 1-epimerase family protein n=1 Tax=Arachidicoccus terrestris TaxID=2875539 RepID=UPI001CC4D4E4|nr:aldose 1-epimerase family protein [Arachidicoccus terrestris]UAY54060.1 aldose 1-epimerase family protein [Arachidicoccus terrestris]